MFVTLAARDGFLPRGVRVCGACVRRDAARMPFATVVRAFPAVTFAAAPFPGMPIAGAPFAGVPIPAVPFAGVPVPGVPFTGATFPGMTFPGVSVLAVFFAGGRFAGQPCLCLRCRAARFVAS